jgi:hypothetical protein
MDAAPPGAAASDGDRPASFDDLVRLLRLLRRATPGPTSPSRIRAAGALSAHRALAEHEVRHLLGVSAWTVRAWCSSGVLEAVSAAPLSVSAASAAWARLVLEDAASYPDSVRRWLLSASLDERDRLLAAVLRGRTAQPGRVPVIDLRDPSPSRRE